MKIKRQIIDNFLPYNQFKLAQSLIMDYGFPWMWNDSVTNEVGYSDPSEFQFVHLFYDPLSGVTTQYPKWMDIVKPYGDKFNPISLMRIKANLNVATKLSKYCSSTCSTNSVLHAKSKVLENFKGPSVA